MDEPIQVPPQWEQIRLSSIEGVILIAGAPDVGKSTFARYLTQRLSEESSHPVAYLDGDPGQTSLGPPGTMTVSLNAGQPSLCNGEQQEDGKLFRFFVGSTSPRGHMLPAVVGAGCLVHAAQKAGAKTVVLDSSGFVDPSHGGLALLLANINLLHPVAVIAIQRESELEPLLAPLQRSQRTRVIKLKPSPSARRRNVDSRRNHRADRFARHFSGASRLPVDWTQLAVFPTPRFSLNRLLALEDRHGFALALGIVVETDQVNRRVALLTPLPSLQGVTALNLGDLSVDPETFQDERKG